MRITRTIAASLRAAMLTAALLTALSVPATAFAVGSHFCTYFNGTTVQTGCFNSGSDCDAHLHGDGSCSCELDLDKCPSDGSAPATNAAAGTTAAPERAGAVPERTKLVNPLGTNNINVIVGRGVSLFMGLSGTFALVAFVYGGFLMITSGGDSKKYASGLNSLKWAVVGLLVIFGSYAFLNTFLNALLASGS